MIAIIAGACGVVTIFIAVNHFRRDDSSRDIDARTRLAARAAQSIEERGGFSARPEGYESGADAGTGVAGPASARSGVPALPGTAANRGGTGGGLGGSSGGPTVMTSERQAGGVVGFSGNRGEAPGGGTSIRLSAPDTAVKFGGAGNGSGAHDEQVVLANVPRGSTNAADPNKPPEDPNEPVLSLPLDRTVEPDKGDAPVTAQGITFDSAGAKFSADAQFIVPNAGGLTGEAGTISFNLQNDWTGNDSTDASLLKIRDPNQWQDRIEITKNGQYLRMVLWDDAGNETGVNTQINWQPGEQHSISVTWGEGSVGMNVDGRLVGQSAYPGQLVFQPGTPMYIGSDVPGGQGGARSTLSDIKVYNTKQ
ncbi:MAG TPA: LamG-like jellyroll fold domain-containing protein [Candidatus Binatia bacterium]|nr:LamG-like jellyroll fold domain-containing protein [Candidatus Binatia bacterium]